VLLDFILFFSVVLGAGLMFVLCGNTNTMVLQKARFLSRGIQNTFILCRFYVELRKMSWSFSKKYAFLNQPPDSFSKKPKRK